MVGVVVVAVVVQTTQTGTAVVEVAVERLMLLVVLGVRHPVPVRVRLVLVERPQLTPLVAAGVVNTLTAAWGVDGVRREQRGHPALKGPVVLAGLLGITQLVTPT